MTVEDKRSRYSADFDLPVRGDTITADRYITREWMELELSLIHISEPTRPY